MTGHKEEESRKSVAGLLKGRGRHLFLLLPRPSAGLYFSLKRKVNSLLACSLHLRHAIPRLFLFSLKEKSSSLA